MAADHPGRGAPRGLGGVLGELAVNVARLAAELRRNPPAPDARPALA